MTNTLPGLDAMTIRWLENVQWSNLGTSESGGCIPSGLRH